MSWLTEMPEDAEGFWEHLSWDLSWRIFQFEWHTQRFLCGPFDHADFWVGSDLLYYSAKREEERGRLPPDVLAWVTAFRDSGRTELAARMSCPGGTIHDDLQLEVLGVRPE